MPVTSYQDCQYPGLTIRDEFAKAAMQGILSGYARWPSPEDIAEIARRSVWMAEAQLRALEPK